MRFLHTSDWHLGRSFHRVSLLDAQAAFLDHLVATVRERERRRGARSPATSTTGRCRRWPPSSSSTTRCTGWPTLGVPTVMISGNHDSARRLGVGAGLIGRAGIHLRTDPARLRHSGAAARRARRRRRLRAALSRTGPGPRRVRRGQGRPRGGARRRHGPGPRRPRGTGRGTRSVVLAHAFVTGGAPSDSERDITVGGVAAVPAGVFDGVDYVALGHLHGCQTPHRARPLLGLARSPTPSPRSDHRKTMWLVDLGARRRDRRRARRLPGAAPARPAPRHGSTTCSPTRRSTRARGGLGGGHAHRPGTRPTEPMARLAERFPHTLSLVFDPERDRRTTPPRPTPGASRAAATSRSPRTSWPTSAAAPARRARSGGVLRDAFDAVRADDAVRRGGADAAAPARRSPPSAPSPARQEVDFDALSAAGLFLLHGPTGAGKTSVLDAVCYALYGAVPGARQAPGTRLRSDHAAPGTPHRGRARTDPRAAAALEITRRPEQPRPKKRGSRHHHGEGRRACCASTTRRRAVAGAQPGPTRRSARRSGSCSG